MANGVPYSTNVFLKFHIQQTYRNDIHYVWCSEAFDSGALGRYAPGAGVPPTSNPVDIFRDLQEAVRRNDLHDVRIEAQKGSLLKLAVDWAARAIVKKLVSGGFVFKPVVGSGRPRYEVTRPRRRA